MPDYMGGSLFALQFDDEASYGTQSAWGAPYVFWATRPEITFGREIEDLRLGISKDFSVQPRVAGSRHGGTFSFTMPSIGQTSAYTAPGALTDNPLMVLLEDFFGAVSDESANGLAADVAGASTAILWKFVARTPPSGSFAVVGVNGAQTVEAIGWGATLAVNDLTMFEDSRAIPTVGNDYYGGWAVYSAGADTYTSKTFRLKGISDDHDLYLIGCVPEGFTLRMTAGMIPMFEWTFRFNDWFYDAASGDGLPISASEWIRHDPIMVENLGRFTFDGGTTGTADVSGTSGFADLQVEVTADLANLPGHGYSQGVADVLILRRNARITYTAPFLTTYIGANETTWDTSLEAGTTHSLMAHVGATVGRVLSVFVPAAVVVEQAQLVEYADGLMGHSVVLEPEEYAGDGGSTAPADTTFRIGFS
jgi:hypothetical protein